MKKAYIVNYYTNEKEPNTPNENDNITIYLSKKHYQEKAFCCKFPYKNTKSIPYLLLDQFFMKLKEMKELGYELEFKCERKDD